MYLALILLFVLIFILYSYGKRNYTKWKSLNVPGPEPTVFFGNMTKVALLQSSITECYHDIYKKFPECKYVGIYIMDRPAILIRDPEIVEDVLVKNFAHFRDNDLDVKIEHDEIFGDNPIALKGEAWKKKRTQHLASFTPGKVKIMLPEIEDCANRMVDYLERQIEKNCGKFCMQSLELGARYTTETVTAVGVNLKANSFTDEKPELREAGRVILEPSLSRSIKLYLVHLIPKLSNVITVRMMPKSLVEKYKGLILQTLAYRSQNNIEKNDFFNHLKEFRGQKMTLTEMVSQLGALYIDGFGTNSGALNFIFYHIAADEGVQKRLRCEIRKYLGRSKGVLTAEDILEMPYLDAVFSESIRKFPPFPNYTRRCTTNYTLPKASEESSELTVEVGTPVIVPAYSIQNDARFFSNPEKFDPERFLGENRDAIVKYSYVPFGEGPRICLGMRFGILQSKVAIIKLIQNFRLSVNYDKTKLPIKIHPHAIILAAKGGLWINFEKL